MIKLKSEIYTIDRFEGNKAVLLLKDNEEQELLMNREELPDHVEKGDILKILSTDNENRIEILRQETKVRREGMETLLDKIRKKNAGR